MSAILSVVTGSPVYQNIVERAPTPLHSTAATYSETMEEVQRLRVKRRGLKGSITKLLSKVDEALNVLLEAVSIESTLESKRILVATTIEQLRMKLDLVTKLDNSMQIQFRWKMN